MKRNPALINQAKRRDNHRCQRCASKKNLHGHHKHAIADGGPDKLDNIITLCNGCHREWHHQCEGKIDFEVFTRSVPGFIIYAVMDDEDNDHLTLGEVRTMYMQALLALWVGVTMPTKLTANPW